MEEELKRTATPSSLMSSLLRPSLTSHPRTSNAPASRLIGDNIGTGLVTSRKDQATGFSGLEGMRGCVVGDTGGYGSLVSVASLRQWWPCCCYQWS
ncbi:hypothetical protein ZEAMMB73_Zm00001d006491 [Zea mays]|uniref:Uncharacterized protein n=1 Tax=Zea mays TaxID=4577 RepID=A0A1D6EX10_MAIZE|nr:hypothetical protein ZEAMMB73_Zm00001d006491 [Zea mays]